MLDLFNTELPDTIEVNGSSFFIQTDFRYLILFQRLIEKKSLLRDFLFMFPYEKPEDLQAGVNAIIEWMNPKEVLPRTEGSAGTKVLDYTLDADYIFAAFMEQYNIDLMDIDVKMHWYKFQALLKSLHDVKLCEIMSYRCYTPLPHNHDRSKDLLKLRAQWELPQPEDNKAEDDLEAFNQLFEEAEI